MRRKPRYYIEFAVVGQLEDSEVAGKSDRRLYTYDDLEFMFRLANPFYADEWMLGVKLLRRRQFTILKVKHENGFQVVRITRY